MKSAELLKFIGKAAGTLFFMVSVLPAQTGIDLTGAVRNNDGQMVQGANVTIRGSALSTTTGAQGTFRLQGTVASIPGRHAGAAMERAFITGNRLTFVASAATRRLSVELFNTRGQKVSELFSGKVSQGVFRTALFASQRRAAPGLYFVTLRSDDFSACLPLLSIGNGHVSAASAGRVTVGSGTGRRAWIPDSGIAAILDIAKTGYAPERRNLTSFTGALDTIMLHNDILIPQPQRIVSMDPPQEMNRTLVVDSGGSAGLGALVREIAADRGMNITNTPEANSSRLQISFGTQSSAVKNFQERGVQGYTLDVTRTAQGGIVITIAGGNEAGAYYGLQTLRQLLYAENMSLCIRPMKIADWPAFQRRGIIICDASDALVKTRTDFASRFKLNLLVHCGLRGTWDQAVQNRVTTLKTFCDRHYTEFTCLMGYLNALVDMGDTVTTYYGRRFDAGVRSFTINFDDQNISTMQLARSVALSHAAVANKVCRYLRQKDSSTRFVFCPVPYGGKPSTGFAYAPTPAIGVQYLNIIGDSLPADVPIYWTGDVDVFSPTVTVAGANEIETATRGRKPFLWDNDAIRFANNRKPFSGREAGLYQHLSGYLANLNEGETQWRPDKNGEFALITLAMYCWNPEKYDPAKAAVIAENILKGKVTTTTVTATASSVVNQWGWTIPAAIDGKRTSTPESMGWSSYDSLNVSHTEWIQLDRGMSKTLSRVDLYPRDDGVDAGLGFPVDFTIKVSSDAVNWTTVVTQTGLPQPAGTVQSYSFNAVNARYVKITGTKLRPNPNDGNKYYMQLAEIELFPPQ